jgi:hypothetical protein
MGDALSPTILRGFKARNGKSYLVDGGYYNTQFIHAMVPTCAIPLERVWVWPPSATKTQGIVQSSPCCDEKPCENGTSMFSKGDSLFSESTPCTKYDSSEDIRNYGQVGYIHLGAFFIIELYCSAKDT